MIQRSRNSPKRSLPLARVYRLLEPGPVVLLTTAYRGRMNVMTMSWHTMLEFDPPLDLRRLWIFHGVHRAALLQGQPFPPVRRRNSRGSPAQHCSLGRALRTWVQEKK